jgi:hypothetical protein
MSSPANWPMVTIGAVDLQRAQLMIFFRGEIVGGYYLGSLLGGANLVPQASRLSTKDNISATWRGTGAPYIQPEGGPKAAPYMGGSWDDVFGKF